MITKKELQQLIISSTQSCLQFTCKGCPARIKNTPALAKTQQPLVLIETGYLGLKNTCSFFMWCQTHKGIQLDNVIGLELLKALQLQYMKEYIYDTYSTEDLMEILL